MTKVFVTGATGFIGQALIKKMISLGYEVQGCSTQNGDIACRQTLENYDFSDVSQIFHLAAKTFVPNSWVNPAEFYRVNVQGTNEVLDICRKNRIGLTYISAYIYGNPLCLPISEDCSITPNNPYGHSKYLAEQLCRFYSENFGVSVKIIRPFNVYGSGQTENFLVPTLIKQALLNDEIKVKNLVPKRDYVYIDDVVSAIISASQLSKLFGIYNIGSGYSVSVQEIIDRVQHILGSNKPVVSENEIRINEINDVVADISLAMSELHWTPLCSLDKGLTKMVHHAKESYNVR
ncbi:nucleoside-diphosphate-sugar epimerase [Sporomusaceae bacterium BoRhaA]|uniref:NAD-dependent epimerase/dehydratase family protein n=1 Tax=Pelorhabdus rhamnosifermentans TaxID=2772457 RepID=UPI001C061279|nr:NAD(P)-dependent oxidoreductase [Pelorhabdus rhamnosifermentans]MBU2699167.1 nucleoside-diphosphate-sugar epimerase [Pelorhabdus rhamnosifermentans]